MKRIRVFIAILIIVFFCWLHWWVLPDLAIVWLADKEDFESPMNKVFIYRENSKTLKYRVVEDIQTGWAGVLAAWPYVLTGIMLGLGIGYFVGERTGRKSAIDIASKKAINQANRIMSDARELDRQANHRLLQGKRMEHEFVQMSQTMVKEIKRMNDHKDGEVEKTQKELLRARETIKKLITKISNLKKERNDEEKELTKEAL